MHHHKIVDITPVIFGTAGIAHIMVKTVEIIIGKKLRRQIADGQTFALGHMKKALARGQAVPVGTLPFDKTVFLRTVENGFINQLFQQSLVAPVIFFIHQRLKLFIEDILVHAHKERLNIHFKDIAVPGIIV